MDIPEFDGRLDPDEFYNWLLVVKRTLDCKEVPLDRIIKRVVVKLIKNVSLWWENLKRMRTREGQEKIVTWPKMKKALQRKYLLDHYRQDLFLKLHPFKQDQRSVKAYIAEFEELMLKCNLNELEENSIARFLGGLKPTIINMVQLHPYWTLQDVINLSIKVEK